LLASADTRLDDPCAPVTTNGDRPEAMTGGADQDVTIVVALVVAAANRTGAAPSAARTTEALDARRPCRPDTNTSGRFAESGQPCWRSVTITRLP